MERERNFTRGKLMRVHCTLYTVQHVKVSKGWILPPCAPILSRIITSFPRNSRKEPVRKLPNFRFSLIPIAADGPCRQTWVISWMTWGGGGGGSERLATNYSLELVQKCNMYGRKCTQPAIATVSPVRNTREHEKSPKKVFSPFPW